MSNPSKTEQKQPFLRTLLSFLRRIFTNNWKLKLLSLVVSVTIWGALISEDASLTREKVFSDVPITVSGVDTLQRNGMIIVKGLENLQLLRMTAEVPQKSFDAASPANYSVRVDVSRITGLGEQKVPIQTLSTSNYGSITWMSTNELTVVVDEYITKRRVPVRLHQTGRLPEGVYAANVSADPNNVVISGPKSLVEKVSSLAVTYNAAAVDQNAGTQYAAVPFRLMTVDGQEIDSRLISVTSENILLDTILVEQTIYPVKAVDINLTGIIKGKPLEGYQVGSITADPPQLRVAGPLSDLAGIKALDLASVIDITGMSEPVIRALKVEKPAGAVHLSENSVYITVEIVPLDKKPGE